jgi:thiol-disulfide isomerase/thioredoxin
MDIFKRHERNLLIIGVLSLFVLIGCNDSPSTDSPKKSPTEKTDKNTDIDKSVKKTAGNPDKADSKTETLSITIVTQEQYQKELEKHKGKVIFVDFWATWCINCIKGMKETVELSKAYEKDGLVILMMCLDENSEGVMKRAKKILLKRKCLFTSLMAKDGSDDKTFQDYKIEGDALPHYKLYDREGKLIQAFISNEETAIDHEAVKKKIEEALKK